MDILGVMSKFTATIVKVTVCHAVNFFILVNCNISTPTTATTTTTTIFWNIDLKNNLFILYSSNKIHYKINSLIGLKNTVK